MSASVPSSTQRLPPNPRRTKVHASQRQRVIQACNSCHWKRMRCSGEQPCVQCRKSSRDCVYPATKNAQTVARTEFEDLRRKVAVLEQALQNVASSAEAVSQTVLPLPNPQTASDLEEAEDRAANNGRVLQDPDGTIRFLGGSSGAAFLDRLRELLGTAILTSSKEGLQIPQGQDIAFIEALGKYQTHDSRPLVVEDSHPAFMPSQSEATAMIAGLRTILEDQDGDGCSGGIYYWGDLAQILDEHENHIGAESYLHADTCSATCNAAFALACQLSPASAPSWASEFGQEFFAKAQSLLGNPLTSSAINDIPALAMMGFYMLGMNRRDAAYMYVSVAIHVAITHGIHRGWMVDERGKRLFWSLYILDRSLSCLMGRPTTVSDGCIKLDVPREESGTPSPLGLMAHLEISKVSNYIVSNIYDVARTDFERDSVDSRVEHAVRMLRRWIADLPVPLQIGQDLGNCSRASLALHMVHNQLLILTLRPLLFIAVKQVIQLKRNRRLVKKRPVLDSQINICADAARRNIILYRQALQADFSGLLYADMHNIFNAALVLELCHVLHNVRVDGDVDDIAFAIRQLEVNNGGNADFASDCASVLSELWQVIIRLEDGGVPLAVTPVSHASTDHASTPLLHSEANNSIQPDSNFSTYWNTRGSAEVSSGTGAPVSSNLTPHSSHPDHDGLYDEVYLWLNNYAPQV